MKEYLKSVVDPNLTLNNNLNRVREYLQAYFLYVAYKTKFYQNLVFTGGTALRFVHQIRRFSEDINFSLSNKAKNYDFNAMINQIQQEFNLAGYDLNIKHSSERTVHSALLKFSGILNETGPSPLKDQKIIIKVEIDTNPPRGGVETNSVYKSTFMFYTLHYDLPSLLAGKIHALLCREYAKGRDWYDLLWYMGKSKELEPNFTMLNNAMAQTEKNPIELTSENWKDEIKKVAKTLDWKKLRDDVGRFLEDQTDLRLLELDTFINLTRNNINCIL